MDTSLNTVVVPQPSRRCSAGLLSPPSPTRTWPTPATRSSLPLAASSTPVRVRLPAPTRGMPSP